MSKEGTEKPTPRRVREARREGRIARSPDVSAWAGVLVASQLVTMTGRMASERLRELFVQVGAVVRNPDPGTAIGLLGVGMRDAAIAVAPLGLGLLVVGVASNAGQGGVHLATKALKPQFKRLNPFTGLKRMFGTTALWQLLQSLIKTAVVALLVYRGISGMVPTLMASGALPLATILSTVGSTALSLMRTTAVVALALAGADYAVQRFKLMRSLRMTKREVQDEAKQQEGDPHVKGQIRAKQLAMARNRMIADVAKSDVVVVNPTHVAVALRYDAAKGAPRVVAKGAGAVAAAIRAEADKHRVPMVEDVPLARALHKACEVGEEIPAQMYTAVARVLAFVIALKARGSAAGVHRLHPVPAGQV